MVETPYEYRWSSHRFNAQREKSDIVVPHPDYLALGSDSAEQTYAYRELFRYALEPEQVHTIRATVQTGTPLGNDRFRQDVERMLKCKVGQARRGNPGRRKGY